MKIVNKSLTLLLLLSGSIFNIFSWDIVGKAKGVVHKGEEVASSAFSGAGRKIASVNDALKRGIKEVGEEAVDFAAAGADMLLITQNLTGQELTYKTYLPLSNVVLTGVLPKSVGSRAQNAIKKVPGQDVEIRLKNYPEVAPFILHDSMFSPTTICFLYVNYNGKDLLARCQKFFYN